MLQEGKLITLKSDGLYILYSYDFNIFREEEYVAHTKCISEAERYGGKNFVAKANANKGERKQQQWICAVNSLLNGEINLSNAEIKFLQILSKYENIPRKKSKFLNFVKNAVGSRVNMTVVETIWNKMENAHKKNLEATIQFEEPGNLKSLFNITFQPFQGHNIRRLRMDFY